MLRQSQISLRNLLVKLFVVEAFERETPTKECKEQNPCSVDISRRSTKLLLLHYLRCHIRWRATEQFNFLCVRYLSTEPKIDQLHISLLIQHHVLKLDVSVCDTLTVQVK